jgi:hypothetical protein
MQLIFNNPYRVLGILVGATAREQNRQVNNLTKYIEAGQNPPVDYSFPVIGAMNRTVRNIVDAAAKLNLNNDKMNAALFWFYKGSDITDEPAFNALKEGNISSALDIWYRLIVDTNANIWREITTKNASAYHNYFVAIFLSNNANKDTAIIGHIRFLESDFYSTLVSQATDNTFRTTKKELQLKFLHAILNEIENGTMDYSLKKLIDMPDWLNYSAKQDFLKSIAQKFTANITVQIETARRQRTANKANAAKAGENLYNQTKDDLAQLKNIFGTQDFNYSNIADKVANEVLQCSIDFFNDSQEKKGDNNYHEKVEKLAIYAKGIAVGPIIKGRTDDAIHTLDMMKDKKILQAIKVLKMLNKTYDDIKFDWRKSINTDKVNEILKEVFTPDTIRKIEICKSYSILNEYTELLCRIIQHSSSYNWLSNHSSKIANARNDIGKQELLEKLSLKMQSYSTDNFKNIKRIIEILKLSENYHRKIRENIIFEEITDNVLISIAQCGNSLLISEFYENTIKNSNLLIRTEKVFIEKLPPHSTLKKKIADKIEAKKKLEKERRESERVEAKKREQERLREEKRERERKIRKICLWVVGIIVFLSVVYGIWGTNGLIILGVIIIFLAVIWLIN